MANKIVQQLQAIVGTHVRVTNDSDEQMTDGQIHIHVHGKLEYCDDDDSYYVRINEDPRGHGCNGIGFWPANVIEVGKESSGIYRVSLKG